MIQQQYSTHDILHRRFRFFGHKALEFRQKCIGMLPQIFKEKIYEKKGCFSIFEYAAKYAGLSHKQVKRTLSLHNHFKDMPLLQRLLESGTVSLNKLARVASIATPENQEFWADQVRLLPKSVLETLVRDEQLARKNLQPIDVTGQLEIANACVNTIGIQNQDGLFETENGQIFVPGHKIKSLENKNTKMQGHEISGTEMHKLNSGISKTNVPVMDAIKPYTPEMAHPLKLLNLKLTKENLQKLLALQEKNIDINAFIAEMLKNRELDIQQQKEQIAAELQQKQNDSHASCPIRTPKKPSRYIPVKIRRVLGKEFGDKCAIPGCNKPTIQKHHTVPFALAGTHDPRFMTQICEDHHKIVHSIDVKFHEVRRNL